MAECPSCGSKADSIDDRVRGRDEHGRRLRGDDPMVVCPDCDSILGFATGGAMA